MKIGAIAKRWKQRVDAAAAAAFVNKFKKKITVQKQKVAAPAAHIWCCSSILQGQNGKSRFTAIKRDLRAGK
ncbi:uncharacterized protein G2W53_015375 [Senna tora]|uniref:Uncharacterized protein n=1 Tax=Senna tora TaxID=362788 RepID=A0A835C9R8_9FABA|nr:uncharacterized protein G2W53_015375 [Senna tora]